MSTKLIHWTRFAWDLEKLGEPPAFKMPVTCEVRPATRRELENVQAVVANSFALDSDWAETYRHIAGRIARDITEAFSSASPTALVLAHGPRLVGATVYSTEPEAENHLVSGPCVLLEYRNRGFGTDLLARTLKVLREAGLKRAHGVTKRGVPAEKFVYPKFNGEGAPHDPADLAATG